MKSEWQSVVTAALLGVERQPPRIPEVAGEPGRLLSQLSPSEPERSLLLTAGILNLCRKAGTVPPSLDPSPSKLSIPETQARCGTPSVQFLQLMLSGTHSILLPEWFKRTIEKNLRVPEELLPSLLTRGKHSTELRDDIQRVIGNRGEWLAAHNPEWHYISALSDDESTAQEIWETGEGALRILHVRRLREKDPNRAREAIEGVWKQEPAQNRIRMIRQLEVNLSMADEPFLEAALDDRSGMVGETAIPLLSRLPDSRFVRRMIERAQPLLRWNRGLLKKGIEVTLPEFDEGMTRDRIDQASDEDDSPQGRRAGYLINILSGIPPKLWENEWQKTPTEIVRGAKGEWEKTLHEGWTNATLNYRSPDWGLALLEENPMRRKALELIAILPREKAEEIASRQMKQHLRSTEFEHQRFTNSMISKIRPWSSSFTHTVMAQCEQAVRSREVERRAFFSSLPTWVATHIPAEMTGELIDFLTTLMGTLGERGTDPTETWHYASVQSALDVVRFRHNMNQAFTNE